MIFAGIAISLEWKQEVVYILIQTFCTIFPCVKFTVKWKFHYLVFSCIHFLSPKILMLSPILFFSGWFFFHLGLGDAITISAIHSHDTSLSYNFLIETPSNKCHPFVRVLLRRHLPRTIHLLKMLGVVGKLFPAVVFTILCVPSEGWISERHFAAPRGWQLIDFTAITIRIEYFIRQFL